MQRAKAVPLRKDKAKYKKIEVEKTSVFFTMYIFFKEGNCMSYIQ